ncbi:MAG: CubicO group peptidase (beta-lactamase class C family) [Oleiphilaceae bacterium]
MFILTDVPLHIAGYCKTDFALVRQAFTENLKQRSELGASISVMHEGKMVVDLWGGYQDIAQTKPWEQDSLVCVMSVSKGIASLCILTLADQKKIKLDELIADYWPEFAQAGKENITIRCLLAQLAGIPVADAAPENSIFQLDILAKAFEVQKPLWEPGSTPCYHSFSYGPLCQELVKRITGKTLGTFLREDLFGPRGIEFYIGVTPEEESRCTEILVDKNIPSIKGMQDGSSLLARAWRPAPLNHPEDLFQQSEFRRGEFASCNGHSNARALAQIYGPLSQQGGGFISNTLLEDAIVEQWDAVEKMTNRHFRYSSGFMLNNRHFSLGPNPRSFGHPGLGGALAFADPDAELGFGYCGNRIHAVDNNGACGTALIDAMYQSL